MKNQTLYALGLLVILLSSCGKKDKYEFWDISKFNMEANALKDSSKFKLIYCSYGPGVYNDFEKSNGIVTSVSNDDMTPFLMTDYYIHYVVVELENNDTLNILVPEAIEITASDNEQTFFYSKSLSFQKNLMYRRLEMDEFKDNEKFNLDEIGIPKHERIARGPEYDHIADNNFKTVIGIVDRIKK